MPSTPPKKVFCSHRSTDKPAVEDFARRLRKRGIDAWFDGWEIQPGDDLVARINQGLVEADVGLIFFSRATAGSPWVSAEVSVLIYRMITEGKPIIPVMIEVDAEVPALLRPRARRGIEELDAVVDAILGRSVKPPLGPSPSATRVTRFCLRLEGAMTSPLDLRAELDGQEIVHLPEVVFPPTLRLSFAEFLSGRLKAPRGPAEAAVASLEASLGRLGSELGGVLFSGAIGEALSGLLGHVQAGEILEVAFEASDPIVLSLPFEACRLTSRRYPAGQPIALYPEVVLLRRPTSLENAPRPPSPSLPGPLKILVAVGAPDEGKTKQSVLDLEADLQGILDTVERASQLGNAQVRILEVGHPEEIRQALAADAYHVLHLSGHGGPGVMELEDEDGGPVVVTAQALAAKIHEAGHPLPLVFLSSCHGGTAASGRDRSDTTSFAQDLLQAGLPLVVAMQSRATDAYASELAASF